MNWGGSRMLNSRQNKTPPGFPDGAYSLSQ
ncbi:hypothetical protein D046_6054A, partial [Vibrio parahaemolyticus V-223/04]